MNNTDVWETGVPMACAWLPVTDSTYVIEYKQNSLFCLLFIVYIVE